MSRWLRCSSKYSDILGRRALPPRRLAHLGATPDSTTGCQAGKQRAAAIWMSQQARWT